MSRIAEKFKELKSRKESALIPYIMAGDPDLGATRDIVLEIARSGADIIEIGAPFSDPVADGPTIQRAGIRALATGTTLKNVIGLVREVRKETDIPVILMLYYNLIHHYGEEKFAHDAAAAGVDGLIVPDLPPDEASGLARAAKANGIDIIFLLAPTSSDDRVRLVEKHSSGFIYYVSLTGVTGARTALDSGIEASLKRIRRFSKKPVCVGFGISTPEQAAKVSAWADGVIVGSALVGIIEKNAGKKTLVREVGRFVKSLKKGITAGAEVK
jgi:tryptophan synthase alpha chain